MNGDVIEGYIGDMDFEEQNNITNRNGDHIPYFRPDPTETTVSQLRAETLDMCERCGGTDPTSPPAGGQGHTDVITDTNKQNHIEINSTGEYQSSRSQQRGVPDQWRKGHEEGTECRDYYHSSVMPQAQRKFLSYKVECIIKDVLEAKLRRVKYDPLTCGPLTQQLCSLIKDKTKEFEFDRYKLVTQVLLGQDSDQSVQIATRCLWNPDTDNFAAATFRNEWIYAVAVVYGLYLD